MKKLDKETVSKIATAATKQAKKDRYETKEWYTARALLGNQWANWYLMIGARER